MSVARLQTLRTLCWGDRMQVDVNPENPRFAPMRIYRRVDIMRSALKRWGSVERIQQERRRRLLR
jgi:hypothetical protein